MSRLEVSTGELASAGHSLRGAAGALLVMGQGGGSGTGTGEARRSAGDTGRPHRRRSEAAWCGGHGFGAEPGRGRGRIRTNRRQPVLRRVHPGM